MERLIAHAIEQRLTLEYVSSLIAMTINLARAIDKRLHDSFTKKDVVAWMAHYEVTGGMAKVVRETRPDRFDASIKKVFEAKAPGLYDEFTKNFRPDASDCHLG